MKKKSCRFCGSTTNETFADLGISPLSNAFVPEDRLQVAEPFYPLHAYVCSECFLVQLEEFEAPSQIFNDHYPYFSSFSDSWLKHVEDYSTKMIKDFKLGPDSQVVEIASNDGYLLQFFKAKGVKVLGVEPSANVAALALHKEIPTVIKFFGAQTAQELKKEGFQADLLAAKNVLAHVPDLNDFVAGMKIILKKTGVLTVEFPHLLRLIQGIQFDTIYHEHFSYLSFITVNQVFARHGMTLFDVEELSTHGGSLRIYGCHQEDSTKKVHERVQRVLDLEKGAKLNQMSAYRDFQKQMLNTKFSILEFLINAKKQGKTVVGYGAPAKGNTLLNYCGVRADLIDYTVDRSPHKQGRYLPGSRIPIKGPDAIRETKPDYLLILPWNLQEEITAQMSVIREWGGKFVIPIPTIRVIA
ncbi:class I SAM-dependent methyltransferase [Bdellovibrionota bacterium FG-2]